MGRGHDLHGPSLGDLTMTTKTPEAPPEEATAWPDGEPETLASVLDRVIVALTRFVHFATPEQALAVALWIAHTHRINECDVSPRLAIRAPSKQSGKTRLMEVLDRITYRGWHVVGPTAAVLFRNIEERQPSVLLDEADRLFEQRGEDIANVLQVLNTGHARGSTVPRLDGPTHKLKDFHVFGALALAGIGTAWPDTIIDRSIVINMERKVTGEAVERLRRTAKEELSRLGEDLNMAMARLEGPFIVEPDHLPSVLSDRAQDGWEPLIAIADAAGPEWGTRARAAAVALADAGQVGNQERVEMLLLRDIRAIFEDEGDPEFLPTATLHSRLLTIRESPWMDGSLAPALPMAKPPLSVHAMGRLLGIFDIASKQIPHGPRGYLLADITRNWDRLGDGRSLAGLIPPPTHEDSTDGND